MIQCTARAEGTTPTQRCERPIGHAGAHRYAYTPTVGGERMVVEFERAWFQYEMVPVEQYEELVKCDTEPSTQP